MKLSYEERKKMELLKKKQEHKELLEIIHEYSENKMQVLEDIYNGIYDYKLIEKAVRFSLYLTKEELSILRCINFYYTQYKPNRKELEAIMNEYEYNHAAANQKIANNKKLREFAEMLDKAKVIDNQDLFHKMVINSKSHFESKLLNAKSIIESDGPKSIEIATVFEDLYQGVYTLNDLLGETQYYFNMQPIINGYKKYKSIKDAYSDFKKSRETLESYVSKNCLPDIDEITLYWFEGKEEFQFLYPMAQIYFEEQRKMKEEELKEIEEETRKQKLHRQDVQTNFMDCLEDMKKVLAEEESEYYAFKRFQSIKKYNLYGLYNEYCMIYRDKNNIEQQNQLEFFGNFMEKYYKSVMVRGENDIMEESEIIPYILYKNNSFVPYLTRIEFNTKQMYNLIHECPVYRYNKEMFDTFIKEYRIYYRDNKERLKITKEEKKQAKKEKLKEELSECEKIISAFMNSGMTIRDFLEVNRIDKKDFEHIIKIVSEFNPTLKRQYSEHISSMQKSRYAIILSGARKMAKLIQSGIVVGDKVRKYDLIDYHSFTTLSFDTLKDITHGTLTNEEYYHIIKFMTENKTQNKLNLDDIYESKHIVNKRKDENGHFIEESGRELSLDEKKFIVGYLRYNHFPFSYEMYRCALNRYLNGYLEFDEGLIHDDLETVKTKKKTTKK